MTQAFSCVSMRMYTIALSAPIELEPQVRLNSKAEVPQQPGRPSGEVAALVPLGHSKSFSSLSSHWTKLQMRIGSLDVTVRFGSVVQNELASVAWYLYQSGSVAPSSRPLTLPPRSSQSPMVPRSCAADSVSFGSPGPRSLQPLEPVVVVLAVVDDVVVELVVVVGAELVVFDIELEVLDAFVEDGPPAPSPEPPTSSKPGSGGSPPQASANKRGDEAAAANKAKRRARIPRSRIAWLPLMTKRILVVGAGRVGQVYGHHLAQGGAAVTVLVRSRHAEEARAGYRLHRVGLTGARTPSSFRPDVVTSIEEIARAQRFDEVWLCVATTSLEEGWLREVASATRDATIVSVQPGLGVKQRLERAIEPARVVMGVVAFLAWETPLPSSDDPRELAAEHEPGTAYLVPPLEPISISGTSERRALRVIDGLRAGGLAARLVADAETELVFSTAMLMPLVASLELAGWSLSALSADTSLATLATHAAEEALAVSQAETGRDAPLSSRLARSPLLVRWGARLAPIVAPLDLETYLRAHFTKVGAQTRALLAGYVERAPRHDLPNGAVESLLCRLQDMA